MTDNFTETSHVFIDWFRACQPFLNPKIRLADFRHEGRGRGVVAVQDLHQDEELFSISRSRILNTETSSLAQDPRGQELITKLDDQWLSLIMVMIHEYLLGSESPWKAYFDVLPSTFDTLMFWTDNELAELQASSVKDKIGKTSANDLFNTTLFPVIRSAPDLFPNISSLTDSDLLALAHRMGSIIMAYAFDLEKDPSALPQDEDGYISDEEGDSLPKGMVPMADMLNADAILNNACLYYETDTVSMRTLGPVKAGEELYNDYGNLPRADLLRRYGYLTDNYSLYDVVEIPTDLIVHVVKSLKANDDAARVTEKYLAELAAALDERGFYEDSYDISLHSHAPVNDDDEAQEDNPLFPAGLQMLFYRLLVDNNNTITPPKKYAKKPSALSPAEQSSIRQAYAAVLRARQGQYSTTIEQDRRTLLELGAQISSRRGMAVQVRLGEKLLLQRALEAALATEHAVANANSDADGEERSHKRRR
ncbi:SET domain-containing protein [Myriangium duriaei CBS 260.36]|uniref:SET domain-containing protein n=1 Tax=Myriangium duriaei CBS 260.36 TaxID=1168546 RepID=A0A9P4MM28_9PEZI|nr:SET domain-containing protein [Myriangium duriaei CBS 260.36]